MGSSLVGRRVLITGGAGFIGGHLARALAGHNEVVAVDNLATGAAENVPPLARLVRCDVRQRAELEPLFPDVQVVFHQAALPSVARSLEDPLTSHAVNATGTLNVLEAMRRADVSRIVYAGSSSAYGDTPTLPKREDMPADPRSPYAAAKLAGETYVRIYARLYGFQALSLRYFNVYGPRQNPASPYAAVVPLFLRAAATGRPLTIHGDGAQTRDFSFIEDVVRANILAATAPGCTGQVVNVAGGRQTSILELASEVEHLVGRRLERVHVEARPGDVRDSLADLNLAHRLLGYEPRTSLPEGLRRTFEWILNQVPPIRQH